MKNIRSILITNLIGLLLLLFCLFGYQSYPELFTHGKKKVSHKSIQIDREKLKNKLSVLSTAELKLMQEAGREVEDWNRLLKKTGSSIITEVLKGQGTFWESEHYPTQDTFDAETYSQYYYHAHRPGEHGHFHLFLRQGGIPEKIVPIFYDDRNKTLNEIDTFTHLIAISMDDEGYPIGLFTTNRWVTGEDWFRADDVVKMVKRFRVDHTYPSWVANRWLSAMLILFYPQISQLVYERDQKVMLWNEGVPLIEALNDHELDVTSEMSISVEVQLKVITEILKERGEDSPQKI